MIPKSVLLICGLICIISARNILLGLRKKTQKTFYFEPKREAQGGDGGSVDTLKAVSLVLRHVIKHLLGWLLVDEFPFRIVEGEWFRHYSEICNLGLLSCLALVLLETTWKCFIKRRRSWRKLSKTKKLSCCRYLDLNSKLKLYICFIVHWIDSDWNLHKRILNFHKRETISKII